MADRKGLQISDLSPEARQFLGPEAEVYGKKQEENAEQKQEHAALIEQINAAFKELQTRFESGKGFKPNLENAAEAWANAGKPGPESSEFSMQEFLSFKEDWEAKRTQLNERLVAKDLSASQNAEKQRARIAADEAEANQIRKQLGIPAPLPHVQDPQLNVRFMNFKK